MASVGDAVMRSMKHAAASELSGALVYLDLGAAEALASGGGLAALQQLGAAAVFDLAAATAADLATAALLSGSAFPVRRVALLVTTLLGDAEATVVAACHLAASAAQFSVLACVSEAAHHDEQPAAYGPHCYAAMGAAWQKRLNEGRLAAGGGPCSLAILRCPLPLCPVASSAFVLPAAAAAAALPRVGPVLAGYSPTAGCGAAGDSDDDDQPPAGSTRTAQHAQHGSDSLPAGFALLAHALVDAVATLGFRPEAFSLGPCSRQVCRSMGFVSAQAEGAPPAALVLIDRLADPVSPALHADLLVQRMLSLLGTADASSAGSPAGEGSDSCEAGNGGGATFARLVMPSLDPLPAPAAAAEAEGEAGAAGDGHSSSTAAGSSGQGPLSLLPGSLRHGGDAQAERWLEFLLTRKGRDGPLFIRKWLREAARKENVPPLQQRFKPGSVCAEELRALADAVRRQVPAAAYRHAALLQLSEAAAAAMEGACVERWEALQREEQQLLFACTESSGAAAAQLAELCQLAGQPGSPLQLADVALLVLAAYCLHPSFRSSWMAGGDSGQAFQPQQERQLASALVEAVMAGSCTGTTHSSSSSSSSGGGGGGGGSNTEAAGGMASACATPAWALEQLARRVTAVKAEAAAAAAGAGASAGAAGTAAEATAAEASVAEELQALRLEAGDAVEALLARCRQVAALRGSLVKHVGQLAAVGQDGAPQRTPLLRQIAALALRDQPLPDLQAGATSLSGLLRSGLGRFGLQAGPKPSDCSTVILFVLGGVSPAELHEMMQAVDERAAQTGSAGNTGGSGSHPLPRAPPRIIVGGTSLLQPADLPGRLFAGLGRS